MPTMAAEGEELLAQKPFIATNIEGMALTRDAKATSYAVTIPQAINTVVEIVQLKTMQRVMLEEQRTDGRLASGRAYATLPNRHVLVGTSTGYLYDINPDKMTVTEQTAPQVPGLAFHAAVNGDGDMVYFAASSATGGKLYSYKGSTATWREIAAIPDATGGLGYDKGRLYTAGVRGQAAVTVTTVSSGAVSTMPISGVEHSEQRIEGVFGSVLYLTLSGTQPKTVVYDMITSQVVEQRPSMGQLSSAAPVSAQTAAQAATQTPSAAPQSTVATSTTANQPAPTQTGQTSQDSTTSTETTETNSQNQSAQTTTQTQNQPTTQQTTQTQNTPAQVQATQAERPVAPQAPDTSKRVYYGALSRYDASVKATKTYSSQPDFMPVANNCWIDENRCVVYTKKGGLGIVNAASASFKRAAPSPLVGGAQQAHAIVVDADDTVYVAASVEGAGVLQMDRDEVAERKIIAPPRDVITSLLAAEDTVIAGTDKGTIASYKSSSDVDASPRFSREVSVGSGAVTALVAAKNNQVIFAQAQTGASHGAALGVFNLQTGTVASAARLVLPGKTITTLVYAGGTLYGGTTDGWLFAYDMANGELLSKVLPESNRSAVTSLVAGNQGRLYGVAGATVFAADRATLGVRQTKSFPAQDSPGTILYARSGLVASVGGKIYSLQADDLTSTQIASGAQLAINSLGDMYYSRDGALYRQVAKQQEIAASSGAVMTSGSGFDLASIVTKIGAGSAAVGILLLAVPIIRLLPRRPTYLLQR